MKRILHISLFLICIHALNAQGIKGKVRIGLITSLYLDSSFDQSGNYKLQKNFPKQAISGLEFYEGASLAIDSLNRAGYLATLKVFDLQSKNGNIASLSKSGELDNLNMLVSHTNGTEYLQLAAIARDKNIILINANYPNDGGIRNSKSVFIANPKINSHITVLYNQIIKKWPNANIVWFRRNDQGDERLLSIFNDQNNASRKITFKNIILPSTFSTNDISLHIDSTKSNVLITGSVDDAFSIEFARAIASYPKKGIIHVVGMPNWDGLKEIQGKGYTGIPVYYTSGFFAPTGNKWMTDFDEKFRENIGTKASVAAIRGFELTYYFGSIWAKYGSLDQKQLNDPASKIITDYDFRPVFWNAGSEYPDYHENKRIYFIRRLNGVASLQ